jgi:hypothetical protein
MTVQRPTAFTLPMIGWKEHVLFPKLGLGPIVAKIDTGARTATLHADTIEVSGRRVRFGIMEDGKLRQFRAALIETKRIKSSNGISELRPVIRVTIQIGIAKFRIEMNLTDRTDMDVPMLIGRNAIKGRYLVHAGRTFILDRKTHSL